MKKEIYEISSKYMRDLKKQFDNNEMSEYDIIHKLFRQNNNEWIIKHVNKISLTITYLNGDVRVLPTYNELMKRVKWANDDYKPARKRFIKKHIKKIHAFITSKPKLKNNTIANIVDYQQVKELKQQIQPAIG